MEVVLMEEAMEVVLMEEVTEVVLILEEVQLEAMAAVMLVAGSKRNLTAGSQSPSITTTTSQSPKASGRRNSCGKTSG
jgi:hypothetical protein